MKNGAKDKTIIKIEVVGIAEIKGVREGESS